ncbi:unnamed protein product [Vitrella brassicaformis CCMP3155]|uniref:DUF676 domain-containing protein n=2 Tax=Vitrella brassicaformis TaxID=1169539 RepID=A0A0G4FDH6_VITBC|nr:unnamed protein product [Vitrella brassicaformis CCMP3155]|eukprot:CEM11272.1 unnamed protein product [Vitrella brassicaformis CCMP3155]
MTGQRLRRALFLLAICLQIHLSLAALDDSFPQRYRASAFTRPSTWLTQPARQQRDEDSAQKGGRRWVRWSVGLCLVGAAHGLAGAAWAASARRRGVPITRPWRMVGPRLPRLPWANRLSFVAPRALPVGASRYRLSVCRWLRMGDIAPVKAEGGTDVMQMEVGGGAAMKRRGGEISPWPRVADGVYAMFVPPAHDASEPPSKGAGEPSHPSCVPIDIVLVHGLRGSAFKTWRRLKGEEDNAEQQSSGPNVDKTSNRPVAAAVRAHPSAGSRGRLPHAIPSRIVAEPLRRPAPSRGRRVITALYSSRSNNAAAEAPVATCDGSPAADVDVDVGVGVNGSESVSEWLADLDRELSSIREADEADDLRASESDGGFALRVRHFAKQLAMSPVNLGRFWGRLLSEAGKGVDGATTEALVEGLQHIERQLQQEEQQQTEMEDMASNQDEHWPRELLPVDFPQSRIFVVNYPAPLFRQRTPRHSPSTSSQANRHPHQHNDHRSDSPTRPHRVKTAGAHSEPPRALAGHSLEGGSALAAKNNRGRRLKGGQMDDIAASPSHVDTPSSPATRRGEGDNGRGQGRMTRASHLKHLAATLLHNLREAGVGVPGRPVIFVCHSLGGLLTKLLLEADKDLRRATRGVAFYGVPHLGAPLARVPRLFRPMFSGITHNLRPSDELHRLNENFKHISQNENIRVLSMAESIPVELPFNQKDLVVPLASAYPQYGELRVVAAANHMNICKVAHRHDVRYDALRRFIARILDEEFSSSSTSGPTMRTMEATPNQLHHPKRERKTVTKRPDKLSVASPVSKAVVKKAAAASVRRLRNPARVLLAGAKRRRARVGIHAG